MHRIFPALALFAVLSVGGTLILGLSLGDVRNPDDDATQRMATVHRLAGVSAGLVVLLINSIVVTYFIGTHRWSREVSETYHLDPEFVQRSARLKRGTFPYSLLSMLTIVGVVALGGAADPGATRQLAPVAGISWATLHLMGALGGLAVILFSALMQWLNIHGQREVIAQIMAEVRRIRLERGLDVEDSEPAAVS